MSLFWELLTLVDLNGRNWYFMHSSKKKKKISESRILQSSHKQCNDFNYVVNECIIFVCIRWSNRCSLQNCDVCSRCKTADFMLFYKFWVIRCKALKWNSAFKNQYNSALSLKCSRFHSNQFRIGVVQWVYFCISRIYQQGIGPKLQLFFDAYWNSICAVA